MEKIEDIQTEYIKTLEEGHVKLMLKYQIILKTMGAIGEKLKEVQEEISDALSKVLKP